LRVNEAIRAPEIRLVGEKGEQLGILAVRQALDTARKQSLDLVEVAPTATPPVCRLMDYGKFKYQQAKKEQEAKKGQHVTALREVRLRPKIGVHDFNAKSRSARKLLEAGDKVKVTILFRGREITHPELGFKLLQRMAELMKDISVIDRQPLMENRRMMLILAPLAAAAKPKPKAEAPAATEAPKAAKPAPKPVQEKAPVKEKEPKEPKGPQEGAKEAAPAKEKQEVEEETQNA
jgi:translation initiation factor IF-3